jgi:hypothetical protein
MAQDSAHLYPKGSQGAVADPVIIDRGAGFRMQQDMPVAQDVAEPGYTGLSIKSACPPTPAAATVTTTLLTDNTAAIR